MTYSWSQPMCNSCWDEENPDRPSRQTNTGEQEVCVKCGNMTYSGIYIRIDPKEAPYPTRVK